MTGRERVMAMIEGRQTDRLPCMPITMMFAGDMLGVKYAEYCRDHRVMVDAQIKTAEMFGLDYVSSISDPAREAADYGAKIMWFDDQPPAIIEEEALFENKSKLVGFNITDPLTGGRREDRIRGIELLRKRVGKELFVEGWVEGPCAESADLRGINRLMVDFVDDPPFVHDLFGFCVEGAIRFAEEQIKAGADIIGIGDAAASLAGPLVYQQFVWDWEKKLVDTIHAMGGRVRLHICGNTRRLMNGMGKLGVEFIDVDYPVPMGEARDQAGPRQTLAGNLDPVRGVRDSTPEGITQSLETLHNQAGPHWIVSAGCEICRDTPHENLRALVEYARNHGAS